MSRNNWPSLISPDYYPVKFKNGTKSLIYLKASVHVESIQQKIWLDLRTEEQLALYFQQKLKESISVYRIHHLFFGILLCMMGFAILSLLLQKEKGYLYFLMIILFAVFYYSELIHRDPIYESFYGVYNHQGDFYNLIAYLGGLSMMLFIDATLSLKPILPKLHKVLIGLAVFFLMLFMTHLLLILFGVRPSVQIRFHILLRLITFIPFFGSFVYLAFKHRTQLSKIIIFGVICLGISDLAFNILITQSESNDWVLFNHPQKLLQAGFLLQSFSFLVALVIKQRGLLVEKNKAQINLIDQLRENSELKEKYAHTLQSEVEEKSKELVLEKEKALKSEYENELLKLESELLASQMNPHFIFNSLNSIKYYAQTKTAEETAQYITTFAKLMRMMLQNSNRRSIALSEEIEFSYDSSAICRKFCLAWNNAQ